jgi:prolyl oligopeptidase
LPAYPSARRSRDGDVLHGDFVPDPYRWLEAQESEEARRWIRAQSEFSGHWFDGLPSRARLRARISALWDHDSFGTPQRRGGRLFFTRCHGLEGQPVLWWREEAENDARVLVDTNALEESPTLAAYGVSPDGKWVAYGLARDGADWQEWHVREVATGVDLADHIFWLRSAKVAWSGDGRGFYYSGHTPPSAGKESKDPSDESQIFFHRLGQPQSEDELVHGRPGEREWDFIPIVSEDGRFLIIDAWQSRTYENAILLRKLDEPDSALAPLLPNFDACYGFIGNLDEQLLFWTDLDAPLGRVVAIEATARGSLAFREVVPEAADPVESVVLVGGRLVATYMHHTFHRIKIFGLDGICQSEVELPDRGTTYDLEGRSQDHEAFFRFSSTLMPECVLRLDVRTGATALFHAQGLDFDPGDFVVEQLFISSSDGTRLPMLLSRHRATVPSPESPCLLTGYGGFGLSETPTFSTRSLIWMERGGLVARPGLRGGGEYGRAWHEAGMKANKQHVFDDFIATAEWLIHTGRTSPRRLAIAGYSNGGLLVAACLTQRPELFGAALPMAGTLDMLRFHHFTDGWCWTCEYGSPEVEAECHTLAAYSPYHNITPGTSYPATLVMTGESDDRVYPAHSFKFAAALQNAQAAAAPILLHITPKTGHGTGTSTALMIEELTNTLAFLEATVGAPAGTPPRPTPANSRPPHAEPDAQA